MIDNYGRVSLDSVINAAVDCSIMADIASGLVEFVGSRLNSRSVSCCRVGSEDICSDRGELVQNELLKQL